MMRFVFLLASVFIISACAKKNDNNNNNTNTGCSKPPAPSVSSNSPVNTGDELDLSASFIANAKYLWTGPGFTSSLQNPVIKGAVPAMSGTYSCVATVGNCSSDAGTTTVTVNPGSGPPCNLNENTLNYYGTNYPSSNVGLMPYCISNNGRYEMTGSDTNSTFGIIIYFAAMPTKDQVYSVTDLTTPGGNQVYITAQSVSNGRNYHSLAGQLAYVTVTGGNITVKLCSVILDNPAYVNDKISVSATLGCQ